MDLREWLVASIYLTYKLGLGIMNKLPLRPNVCMLLFNKEGRLFLGERAGAADVWQFPQGGAEEGLSLEENVVKELREELGVEKEKVRVVKRLSATNEYEWETPPVYAVNKWRGQSQTFWLVEFLGEDSEINLSRFDPELMSWKWCTVEEVRATAEPKRLQGYLGSLAEFEEYSHHT